MYCIMYSILCIVAPNSPGIFPPHPKHFLDITILPPVFQEYTLLDPVFQGHTNITPQCFQEDPPSPSMFPGCYHFSFNIYRIFPNHP